VRNPLSDLLTDSEQKILLFLVSVIVLGSGLNLLGWSPAKPETSSADSLRQAVKTDVPLRIDIRTATLEELVSLPGIGEKRAGDIIAYRSKKPFTSVNQLLNIKGIGAKTYAKLLPDLLAFGDSTNLELSSGKETKTHQADSKQKASSKGQGTVNLNTAGLQELTSLVGIGEVKAQAIIDWRTENGGFKSIEDFTKVKGIGQKTFEKNKDRLRVQ